MLPIAVSYTHLDVYKRQDDLAYPTNGPFKDLKNYSVYDWRHLSCDKLYTVFATLSKTVMLD